MPYRLTLLNCTAGLLFTILTGPAHAVAPPDSVYKNWYFTPTGVYGRLPLKNTKYRAFVKVLHPSSELAIVQSFNPANVLVNTTRVYFKNGLISLSTETDRWGYAYDSTWYQPEGPGKFLVTERKKGVNPYIPCKYVEYTFNDGLLTDILCFRDSIRAGDNQEGVAHYVFERYTDPDRHGLIRTETFLNNIDMPAFSRTTDCHKLVTEYDTKGNLVSRSIYDQDDKPVPDRYGVFRTKYKYDGDDNETEADYYDTKDKLTVTGWGYAQKVREYKHGFPTTETYYYDDQTTIVRATRLADSAAIIWYKYDQDGNETETSYFDPQNNPLSNPEGVHKIQYEYSAAGMLTRINKIGLNKESGWDSKIYLSLSTERNDKGLITATQYETNTGVLISDPEDGAYLTKNSYDAWGRVHAKSCWQDDTTKMACSLGYQESVNYFNDDGQLAETDYNDESGNPYTGMLGYSQMLLKYNEQGLPAELSFFAGGKPVLFRLDLATISNFHRLQYNYDGLNRLRSINFYDAGGKPVNAVLRRGAKKEYTAREIDFDYKGALLTGEWFRDSGDLHDPVALDCSNGECLPMNAFASIRLLTPASVKSAHTYHGSIRPDTLIDDQLGFVGNDSILVFLRSNSGSQTGVACSEFYRVAPINKYYQLDGQVTDYFIDNDSIAASLSYVRGNLEGPAYIYYRNGLVKERGAYRNNDRYGIWEYYYDNGQKAKTIQFENGQAFLTDCYTKKGDVLASGGNGRFAGTIVTNTPLNPFEMRASGNVKNGLPDGEWALYFNSAPTFANNQRLVPANVEYFSNGKFRHGVSSSASGKATYSDKVFSRVESIQPYEYLDHYRQDLACRPAGSGAMLNDLYPEIKLGFKTILKTSKYGDYTGWIFLDLHINAAGRVIGSYVRLYRPNDAFEKDIRDMASGLVYTSLFKSKDPNITYEKFYIILVDANDMLIPEEVLASQRNVFRR